MNKITCYIAFIFAFLISVNVNALPLPDSVLEKGRYVISDLVEDVLPSVVNISVEENVFDDIKPSYSNPFSKNQKQKSLTAKGIKSKKQYNIGSGVIISKDGFLITNFHVVELAGNIEVKTINNERFKAELIGFDKKTDLALLKIKSKKNNFKFADFANSDKVRLGEIVIAMGNPYGLESSVSMGIISARNRNIGSNIYDDYLQTDASINPGNSGGPLFNLEGNVIGINTAIFSKAGGSDGIGFAVPSNTVSLVVNQIKENGKVIRGWLGIQAQKVNEEIAKSLNLKSTDALIVSDVIKSSPAFFANIKVGDIILEYDNKKIKSLFDLPKMVAKTPINTEVEIKILREGKILNLKTRIVSSYEAKSIEEYNTTVNALKFKGVYFSKITDQLKTDFNLKEDKGIVIVKVDSEKNLDLQKGDVILQVNQKVVKDLKDVENILETAKEGPVLLFINRGGNKIFKVIGDK